MGLGLDIIEAIVREHTYKPISGDVLLIGRQSIYLTPDEYLATLRSHGVIPTGEQLSRIRVDNNTLNRNDERTLIADTSIFALLGVENVRALDHSDYEGAEVIHDLNKPVPATLESVADFIVDGSTLDNTFNPALTLQNFAKLLRPGGRLIAHNTLTNFRDPYITPMAPWYMDYFVMNQFVDCKVYIRVQCPPEPNFFCIDLDCLLDPAKVVRNFVSPYKMSCVVFAEKGLQSTTDIWPSQGHYRSADDWRTYRRRLYPIQSSARPHIVRSRVEMSYFDIIGGYLFIGNDYVARDPSTEERRVRALDEKTGEAIPTESNRRRTIVDRLKGLLLRIIRKAGYEIVKRRRVQAP
jgi:hypothetical protein